jgi:cell division protein FtsI/penicillin-binding protein 2
MLLVVVRLGYLQIVQAQRWQARADQLSLDETQVPARRGAILDRNGDPLALSETRWTVGVSLPRRWSTPRRAARLAKWLSMSPGELQQRIGRRSEGHIVLARSIVLAPAIEDSLRGRHGITLDPVVHRSYPLGDFASRLLGRVNHAGDGDAGIEQLLQRQLAGTAGHDLVRRTGTIERREIDRISVQPPIDGSDVVLTIDSKLQQLAEESLERGRIDAEANQGFAMVVDPRTLQVLALAEAPPQARRSSDGARAWQLGAAVDLFEPGSTFKLFTAASLLARGVCDTTTRFDGEGSPTLRRVRADLGGFSFEDTHPVGVVTLRHAFAVSSNICFGKATLQLLRASELEADLRRFGFGQRTATGWPGETNGLLFPHKRWVERTKPTIGIGQEIGVSMFQMVAAASALVTDGNLRTPRFVVGWRDASGSWNEPSSNVVRERIVSPSVVRQLRGLTREVVANDYGTGHRADIPGLEVGGKTGTAQIPTPHGYDSQRFLASFLATAPASDPRVLVLVAYVGARGEMRWGGRSAAPIAREILEHMLLTTHWFDGVAEPVAGDAVIARMPDLRGERAADVSRRAQSAGFQFMPPAPSPRARVIGQLPPAGTPMLQGTSVQLAWAEGR